MSRSASVKIFSPRRSTQERLLLITGCYSPLNTRKFPGANTKSLSPAGFTLQQSRSNCSPQPFDRSASEPSHYVWVGVVLAPLQSVRHRAQHVKGKLYTVGLKWEVNLLSSKTSAPKIKLEWKWLSHCYTPLNCWQITFKTYFCSLQLFLVHISVLTST